MPIDDEHDLDSINHRWGGRALSTARIASSAARLTGRRLFRRQEGEADRRIGERLAAELDQMKGMAMKVGQILSYFDGTLPEGTHEALRKLQHGARPVAFETLRPVIEGCLGASCEQLFEELGPTAVAAASIGQVYRARFDGREVAVKVQYPNVAKTIDSDLRRVRRLSKIASLATAVDGPAIADELRERVLEECDYVSEAAHQAAFRKAFADDPEIAIPAVIAARSCKRVLTSEWVDGLDFYAFAEQATQQRRNAVALTLARFAYQSLYGFGALNADPHPGNYLFPDDESVVFLDFGCVRRFEDDFLTADRELARVVIDDRRDRFRDAVLTTGMVPKPKRFDFDAHWEMLCHQYAPYRTPRFRFSRDYMKEGVKFTGPGNPNLRRLAIPPPWIWVQRLQWGLHAVLTRLGAVGPFGDVFRAALEAPPERLGESVDLTGRP